MNISLSFWIVFIVLIALMWYCDHAFAMLRDASPAVPKPYSFARVQLAWWTVVVFSSMIAILLSRGHMPTLDSSTLVLLGISAGTTAAARVIDQSDQQKMGVGAMSQDFKGENFLLDILSDKTGVNIHRLQALLLNLTFGVWFIHSVLHNLSSATDPDLIIPAISNNNLVLLGLSSGTYAALKTTENKEEVKGGVAAADQQPEFVPDESEMRSTQAAG